MVLLKKLKNKIKKTGLVNFREHYFQKLKYTKYIKNLRIDSKSILIESQHGKEMNGNIFYIMKELISNPKYKDFRIHLSVVVSKYKLFEERLELMGIKKVNLITVGGKEYFRTLATAKYLINDTTFQPFFIKREGQIYLNTWHGTPLKTLGKKNKDELHAIGNVQKNFVVADYLLYPNEYTMEHMVEDYMLENLSKAKILLTGYPRNSIFFDNETRQEIIEKENLTGKKVYMYMPTWRGVIGSVDEKANIYLYYFLFEIDKQLKEDEILFVNLHPIAKKDINFELFKNIKCFPDAYETHAFLNVADLLITDYSSVFYDFAVTKRKIVLFTHDEEEYSINRGLYTSMSDLPFPKVKKIDALLNEIRQPKQYDDSRFLEKYCKYDSVNTAKLLCEKVILNCNNEIIEREIPTNGKDNILIYAGNLAQNGITTSIMSLLKNIDTTKHNYFITFISNFVQPNKEVLKHLPPNVNYIATTGALQCTLLQKIFYVLYRYERTPFSLFWVITKGAFKNEIKRLYGDAEFSNVIQFNGYEYKKILLFSQFDCNKIIYVHTDIVNEIKTRNNLRRRVLEYAYHKYNKVAVVTEDIMNPTKSFLKSERELNLAKTVIPHEEILQKSKKDITFDHATKSNVPIEDVVKIVKSDAKVFVNVGRYSPEKGHKRLIDSFDRIYKENPNTYLINIAGNQRKELRDKLLDYIQELDCKDNVVLIMSMTNPFPLLKACDYFVLSSFYEGFGLVLAEANILGLPIISTDINGPRGFMKKYGGKLVENTDEGIYQGMKQLLNDEIPVLNIDYDEYNKGAIEEFYQLLQ